MRSPMSIRTVVSLAHFAMLTLLLVQPASAQRELKDIPPPDPEIERASFEVADGFEVNLYAADPRIAKPIQMNFDPAGRLWIASSEIYPHIAPGQEANDKILIVEDADGDGRADFATLLPTGSPPGQWIWYGGTFSATLVFVSESGTLVNAGVGDIDRDGFADSLLTALDASGAFASLNIVAGGLDRRWNARRMLYVSPGVPFSGSLGLAAVGDSDGDGIDEFVVVSSPLRALYLFGAMATTAGVPTRTLPFPSAAASLITSQ